MNINIKKLTDYDIDIYTKMAEWYNDPELKYLITPRFSEKLVAAVEPEELIDMHKKNKDKSIYVIYDGQKPIGNYSIISKFGGLMNKAGKTAWISIIIGDKSYHGKGVGKLTMQLMEEESRSLGFRYIELGVFEFNKKAKRLYENSGYKEIGRNKEVIYYDGEWCDDIHMVKKI